MTIIKHKIDIKTPFIIGVFDDSSFFGWTSIKFNVRQDIKYIVQNAPHLNQAEVCIITKEGIAEGFLHKRFRQPYKNELKKKI